MYLEISISPNFMKITDIHKIYVSLFLKCYQTRRPHQDGLVVSVFACHALGHGFVPRSGHDKDHHKNGTNYLLA